MSGWRKSCWKFDFSPLRCSCGFYKSEKLCSWHSKSYLYWSLIGNPKVYLIFIVSVAESTDGHIYFLQDFFLGGGGGRNQLNDSFHRCIICLRVLGTWFMWLNPLRGADWYTIRAKLYPSTLISLIYKFEISWIIQFLVLVLGSLNRHGLMRQVNLNICCSYNFTIICLHISFALHSFLLIQM